MHDDVGAVVDRPQQDRRRHRVVDDQRHAVPVRDLGQRFDVADVAGRIADAFAEHGAVLSSISFSIASARSDSANRTVTALARQHMGEQRVRRAVELRHRDDVAAQSSEVEDRIVQRGLAGADAQRLDAAFERGDAPLEHGDGRIADAAVAIAVGFPD